MAHKLGRKALEGISEVFSPDTLLRWHRTLIARKYDGSKSRGMGRPQISEELRAAIIKIAKDNRDWGYIRIQGQLKYLKLKASIASIANVLKKTGLEPQPDRKRKTTWAEFIQSHWQSLSAADFFTTEVYTLKGLTRYMVFVVIDYATRKVEIAGIVEQAYGDWMVQIYHTERAHQGLDNNLIEPPPQGTGEIVRQERLGGLLKFYRRAA